MIVRLCSIECSFARPLEDGDSRVNAKFVRDLRGWSELCERLYIWDYVANYRQPLLPHPNLQVLGPNIRLFAKHGAKGVFPQGGGQGYGMEMDDLRAWMLAKLLWQPGRDATAIISEFVEGYYGSAAPHVRQYLDLTHDAIAASGTPLGVLSTPWQPFLSLDMLGKAEAIFDQAEEAVRHDPACLGRVQVARLPLRYVWCVRWDELRQMARAEGLPWPGPSDYTANAETFLSAATSNGITGPTLARIRKQVVARGRRESSPPPGCEELPPWEYLDVQETEFWLGGREGVAVIGDEQASDGVAVRIECGYWRHANRVVYGLLAGVCTFCGLLGLVSAKARVVIGVATLVSGVIAAFLAIGLVPDRAVGATELTPDLKLAVWTGLSAIIAVILVSGVATWFLLKKTASTSGAIVSARRRGSDALIAAAVGSLAASAMLFSLYSLGGVAHAIQGRRAMFVRRRASAKEGMGAECRFLKALRDVLAAAKKTVQRSSLGGGLDRLTPISRDACDPSWALSRPLCYPFIRDRGPVRCYAVIRCDLTGRSGDVFEGGLYDPVARETKAYRRVSAAQVTGDGYHAYDLGCSRLTSSTYLWIAPAQSRRAARAISVDRVFAVADSPKRAQPNGNQGGLPNCASS